MATSQLINRKGWPRQFRVLLSCASTAVYPDLMCDEVYGSAGSAWDFVERMRRINGYEAELMRLSPDGQWLSNRGEAAVDVIRRRWAA